MTPQPERDDREADVLSRTAPLAGPPFDVARPPVDTSRPPVDETQSTRQSATAPQPKLEPDDADDADDITGEELDEAWAGLTLALNAADQDFDSAAAYARLAQSLPTDLVQMPLVERASAETGRGTQREFRNLTLGLVAMGTVCAGLAGLAFFGPGFERRPVPQQDVAERTSDAPPVSEASPGAGEVWADARWEEDLLALAQELDAERHRLRAFDHESLQRPDEALARLKHDFERTRSEFGARAEF
ncbi:MAG TPA: hypothetical protein VGN57_09150 [Pirellulaceae bacterium]|jgi:hypothetical protein|nr:hypothetical protein [Pirellulaceae bacterium]